MTNDKKKYNFDVVFKKLNDYQASASKEVRSVSDVQEADEINKLREIVLDVSEESERYFSTA